MCVSSGFPALSRPCCEFSRLISCFSPCSVHREMQLLLLLHVGLRSSGVLKGSGTGTAYAPTSPILSQAAKGRSRVLVGDFIEVTIVGMSIFMVLVIHNKSLNKNPDSDFLIVIAGH